MLSISIYLEITGYKLGGITHLTVLGEPKKLSINLGVSTWWIGIEPYTIDLSMESDSFIAEHYLAPIHIYAQIAGYIWYI